MSVEQVDGIAFALAEAERLGLKLEMFLDNLYREASRICRQHGLVLCSESGGLGAPLHNVPTEECRFVVGVMVVRAEQGFGTEC